MEENKYIEEAQYEEVGQRYYDVLPIRNNVVYPGVMMPIAISKKSSLKLLKAANKDERPLILLTQKNNDAKEPTEHDLYTMGVIARVLQIIPVPEMGRDTQMAIFEGLNRVQATDFMEEDGVLKAHAFEMEEHMPLKNDKQFKATVDTIKETVQKIMNDHEDAPAGLKASLQHINSTPTLVNYVCAIYHMPTETKQGLLEIHSLQERATACWLSSRKT
jgi:ATP-dependent Lon protease